MEKSYINLEKFSNNNEKMKEKLLEIDVKMMEKSRKYH